MASGLGAVTALVTAALLVAVLSAILLGTAKYALGLVGGMLGAPLQMSLGGMLGGGSGAGDFTSLEISAADAANAKAFIDLPLTAGAVVPLAGLRRDVWARLRPGAVRRLVRVRLPVRCSALSCCWPTSSPVATATPSHCRRSSPASCGG
jgi:hypothetical protein